MTKVKAGKLQAHKSIHRRLTNTDRKIAMERYLDGQTVSDISGWLNVLPSTIKALFSDESAKLKATKAFEKVDTRVTSSKVLKAIRVDLIESQYLSYAQVAKKHGVSYNVVSKLLRSVFKQMKRKESQGDKCVIGSKTEAYYTEDEMLAPLPTYTAIHRDKITPINPDWKLY